MKVMLAALELGDYQNIEPYINHSKYTLSSYYYLRDKLDMTSYIEHMVKRNETNDFLLDSGAFSALSGAASNVDWDAYVKDYIDFINEFNINQYIEMDIDVVVGYEKVLEYRDRIEQATGKASIPVFHFSRGLDAWKELCEEYDYIAIGGFAIGVIQHKHFDMISDMVQYAVNRNVKVHGLGFTGQKAIEDFMFYSIDSSSWTAGRRFGQVHKFKDGKITTLPKPKNTRVNSVIVDKNNFIEWCKLQRYADGKGWRTF